MREHTFWLINISAEFEIVDFSNVSFIEVFTQKKLIQVLRWRDDLKLLENSSELLSSDVAAVGPIVILELWLDEHTLEVDFLLDGAKQNNQCVLLRIGEAGGAL